MARAVYDDALAVAGRERGGHTAHEVNPGAYAHLLARLHQLQCLVQKHLAGQTIIDNLDQPVGQGEAPPGSILLHADAATEGQLDDDAPAERIADVVVPEREVSLSAGDGESVISLSLVQ
jgi:hypothetical protein